jgi:predicted RNase H-like HicB family nuclease
MCGLSSVVAGRSSRPAAGISAPGHYTTSCGISGFGSPICAEGSEDNTAERKTARCYPLRLEQEADGGYVVTIPDIGYGATQGDTLEEALRQAEDLLEEAILGMMANDEDVPSPSPARGRPAVGLPALTAAKLELYRDAGGAVRQGRICGAPEVDPPSQITRLFDGRRTVRLDQVETVLGALGRRLVVTSEAA